MMTRRLLALFAPGLLMAQTRNRCAELDLNNPVPPECSTEPQLPSGIKSITVCTREGCRTIPPRIPRPKNDECPVCNTLAQPYREGAGSTQEAFYLWAKYSRLTVCEHCSTVFRQWAEGKGPRR